MYLFSVLFIYFLTCAVPAQPISWLPNEDLATSYEEFSQHAHPCVEVCSGSVAMKLEVNDNAVINFRFKSSEGKHANINKFTYISSATVSTAHAVSLLDVALNKVSDE